MMRAQPIMRGANAPVVQGPPDRKQSQNPVGRGSSVAAETRAIWSGFVGIDFGGGKEEAAVGVLGMFRIVVLAALDKYSRPRENRIVNWDCLQKKAVFLRKDIQKGGCRYPSLAG